MFDREKKMDRLLELKYRPLDLLQALEEKKHSVKDLKALQFELSELESLAEAKNASVGSVETWNEYVRLHRSCLLVALAILSEGGKKLVSRSESAPILYELRGIKTWSEEEDKAIQDFVTNFINK